MSAYADVVSVPSLLRPPTADESGIEELIADQGLAAEAVNWIFEQITGESLVEAVIMPITGDWTRIAANGDAWRSTAEAVEAVSDNITANVDLLQQHWDGAASDAFGQHIRVVWFGGLYAQAGIARLIGEGFDVVSDQSRRLCGEALELLDSLVNKLVSAIAQAWIPFYGWGRAVKMVWDAYQIYQSIMGIIDAVKAVIEAAGELFDAVGRIRSAIEAIPDVRNANDAAAVVQELLGGVGDAADAVDDVNDGIDAAREELATAMPSGAGTAPGGGSSGSW
ncbi:MAG TPA: hypothetical protein VGD67_07385 [Pseudonocardiaceae bacterium]